MGELLSLAAKSGIQILIETYSDRVLNGIRLAVPDHKVDPTNVALYHSKWEVGGKSPSLTLLDIDANGRVSQWPDGLFDEMERSLDRLLGEN